MRSSKKVYVVTGASKGLGSYLAHYFNSNDTEVYGLSRNTKRLQDLECDITNKSSVAVSIFNIWKIHKRIDCLINNAGVMNFKSLADYTERDFYETFDVNVKGAMFVSQEVLKYMRDAHSGIIINIGSTRSITSAPEKALYSMSKFALRSLTQSINLEYNKYNIYSTLICPGKIDNINLHYKDIAFTVENVLCGTIHSKSPEIIIGGQL